METYKKINRELSLRNQELRCTINVLKAEIVHLNNSFILQREEHGNMKKSIVTIITKSFRDIIEELFGSGVEINLFDAAEDGNCGTESENRDRKSQEKAPARSLEKEKRLSETAKSIRRSFHSSTAADPLQNSTFSPTVRRKRQRSIPRARQSLTYETEDDENQMSSPEPSSPKEQRSSVNNNSESDESDKENEGNDGVDKETQQSNKNLRTILEEASVISSQTLQVPSINITSNDDSQSLHYSNATRYNKTLSDTTLHNLLDAPCSTPYNKLHDKGQTNEKSPSTLFRKALKPKMDIENSDPTAIVNSQQLSIPRRVCRVRLKRENLEELQEKSVQSHSDETSKLNNTSDCSDISSYGTRAKYRRKSLERSSSSESIATSRPRRQAAIKSFRQPNLKTKMRKS